jgi:hypothetical protein
MGYWGGRCTFHGDFLVVVDVCRGKTSLNEAAASL